MLEEENEECPRTYLLNCGGGIWMDISKVEFVDIEENELGEDVITFIYNGVTMKSKPVVAYLE